MANRGGSYRLIDGERVLIEGTDQQPSPRPTNPPTDDPSADEVTNDAVS